MSNNARGKNLKIAHIVNPVKVTEQSDLFVAQPITFETMKRAKACVKNTSLKIDLVYTCFDEDLNVVPEGFIQTPQLHRSVLDVEKFEKERKLPLIKDILDRLYEVSDADYFIYTNVDIGLMPDFYNKVEEFIESGIDGFVINRRTISNKFTSVEQIDEIYLDVGEKHQGYDCFIFKRKAYEKYMLGTACIGANWIGRVIISNVLTHADKFKVFEDEYLTFHIGDDRSWKIEEYSDFDKHNEKNLIELLLKLLQSGAIAERNLLNLFVTEHHVNDFLQEKIRNNNKVKLDLQVGKKEIYGDKYKPSGPWKEAALLRQDPVFILGYPRSGTTLLQSLLATQDNILTLHETHFFTLVRDSLQIENGKIPFGALDKIIDVIRDKIRFSINAEEHVRFLSKEGILSQKMLFEILVTDNLIDKVNDLKELEKKQWIEKTPDHVFKIDIINRFYPNAKFIFVLRSPEQAILSRRINFSNESKLSIHVHAQRWINSVEAIEAFQLEHPDKVKIIKLEDLVNDKESYVAELCDFIGIEFNREKIQDHNKIAKELVFPWEHWKKNVLESKVSKKIADNQKELNEADLMPFLEITQEKLKHYGYMNDRYKQALENHKKKKNKPVSTSVEIENLILSFDELTIYSLFKNPIKKYKAYKAMIASYYQIKEKENK